MASVRIHNLNKIYPNGFVSVKNVNLSIHDGEFITLHGPHGCGKSTILRMIGGLEEITSGKVYFGEDCISDMHPANRPLAMAFQNYVLYKQLNVYENIALGLRIRECPKHIIERRVQAAADFLGIAELLQQRVKKINASQQQLVALCRALVCKPAVLLVDEEFAHQDKTLKQELIETLTKMNRELNMTILYVTNDYHEATTVGNRVVFMKEGEVIDILPSRKS